MFKVNNRNTRTRCEICSKLTIKTPERRQWRCSGVFLATFSSVSTVDFEKVNVDWVNSISVSPENIRKPNFEHAVG